jgi:myo-inositol 2-dehydrogenase/D-chiro-inositol 1-dehydrogenase
VVVKSAQGFGGRVPEDWRERFVRAYDTEFQEWLDAVAAGGTTGPSSWDGYAATIVCDGALEALRTGERVEIPMREKPDLYGPQGTAGPTGTD